jgi:transposase InsO family protein
LPDAPWTRGPVRCRPHENGPHRLGPELGHPRSTIYAVLRRSGLSRLDRLDRPTGVPIRRYERERPGELVHLDVKKLGRIAPGGGHRIHGDRTRRGRRIGHDYIHVAVDDRSRYAYVGVLPDERGETAAGFVLRTAAHLAEHGITIERVMTGNAKCYVRSRAFHEALDAIGAAHRRTRNYRPQTNGKAERFIQTLLKEWANERAYPNNPARLRRLPLVVHSYNHRRPHSELGGLDRSHGCRQREWERHLARQALASGTRTPTLESPGSKAKHSAGMMHYRFRH